MPTKIRCLRVRPVLVPMAVPHRTASGAVVESPLVLTDVVTDAGVEGRSITFTYTAAALGPTADLIRNLEPLLAGQELAPADLTTGLWRRFRLLATQGLVGMAIAGIDMALWDAFARLQAQPLATALGATPKPIQAYGAVGYDGERDSAAVAEDWARRGVRGVKAKIGYPTVAEDLRVIRAIRAAVGPDVAVMVDYNQSLTPAEAIQRIRALEGEGLAWVEEPVASHDFEGHAEVARESQTPIQSGENWWGPLDLRHAIQAHASDYVMLDVMKIGGVTGWMQASALAAAHNLRVSNHLWPEVSVQLLSATPTAHWLEYADWWNPILENPIELRDGMAIPGAAIEWKS
jgi:mandelate racemase